MRLSIEADGCLWVGKPCKCIVLYCVTSWALTVVISHLTHFFFFMYVNYGGGFIARVFRFCLFVLRARGTRFRVQPDDPAQSEAFELFV